MAMSMCTILIEGVTILISGTWAPNLDWVAGSIVMTTIATKAALWTACVLVRRTHPTAVSLDALVEDHFNDCLTNAIGASACQIRSTRSRGIPRNVAW